MTNNEFDTSVLPDTQSPLQKKGFSFSSSIPYIFYTLSAVIILFGIVNYLLLNCTVLSRIDSILKTSWAMKCKGNGLELSTLFLKKKAPSENDTDIKENQGTNQTSNNSDVPIDSTTDVTQQIEETDTLYVNDTDNQVGINTKDLLSALTVNGTVTISSLATNGDFEIVVANKDGTLFTQPFDNNIYGISDSDAQQLSLESNRLSISGGNSVELPISDSQTLTLDGNKLSISGGNTIELPGNSNDGRDNWGDQYVISDITLTGRGTADNPLKIAQQSASPGQVLKWNGTSWVPAFDNNAGGTITAVNAGAGLVANTLNTTSTVSLDITSIQSCTNASQKIIWDAVNNRLVCSTDLTGVGSGDDWGSQTVVTNTTLSGDGTIGSPLTINLGNPNVWTGVQTFSAGITVTGGTVTLPAGSVDNSELANSSITVTAGTGLSGGGIATLGGGVTLNNTGILSLAVASPLSSTGGQNPTLSCPTCLTTSSTTTNLPEGSNLYFTDARARNAVSATAPLTYNSGTGVFGINQASIITDGYLSATDWNTFNNKENVLSFSSGLTRIGNSITADLGTSIDSSEIVNGTITFADWASNSCVNGDIPKYNGSAWVCGTDTGAGSVSGSGTATQVAFWSSSSALSSSANLYWDNTNTRLGIGTSSPTSNLMISTSGPTMSLYDLGEGRGLNFLNGGGTAYISYDNLGAIQFEDTGDTALVADGSGVINFLTSSLVRMTIASGGNVGINTSSPTEKLDISGGNLRVGYVIGSAQSPGGIDSSIYLDAQDGSLLGTQGSASLNFRRDTLDLTRIVTNTSNSLTFDDWNGSSWDTNMTINTTGNVGIGETSPTSLLSVGSGSAFQVNSSGNIVKINNVTTSFPSSQGAANTVLTNDGSGNLSWSSIGASNITADSLDFTEFQDTLDLDAALTLNQTTNTWSQTFTGTTTTGFTYNADSLSSGTAVAVSSATSGFSGTLMDVKMQGTSNAGTVLRVSTLGTFNSTTTAMVTNLGTGTSFRVNDETGDTDSSPFVIDASGNIGVGTASPGSKFELSDGATTTISTFNNTNASGRSIISAKNTASGTTIDTRAYGASYSETLFGNAMASDVGIIGSPGTGNAMVIGNFSNGDLLFGTNNAERLRIEADGDMGFGTTSPTSTQTRSFHISNSISAALRLSRTTATTADIELGVDSSALGYVGSISSTGFVLKSANTEALRINTSQQVGIGTGSSIAGGVKLDVQGTVEIGVAAAPGTQYALCHTAGNGAQTDTQIVDCNATGTADYMEMYPVNSDISMGDIVVPGSESVMTKEGDTISKLIRSTTSNQKTIIGIVSDKSKAGDFNSIGHNIAQQDNPQPIALAGRVPVKIAQSSDAIVPGDFITTSNEAGKGMKAAKAGHMVGRALEYWSPSSGKSTVMIYVTNTYADPQDTTSKLAFDENGNLIITSYDEVISNINTDVNNQGTKLTSLDNNVLGLSSTTQSISAQQASQSATLTTIMNSISQLSTSLTSVTTAMNSLSTTVASLSAQLNSLINWKTDTQTDITQIKTDLQYLNSQSGSGNASGAASLADSTSATLSALTVSGKSNLYDVAITGTMSAGIISIDGLEGQINTLSNPLKLQALSLGGIEMIGGKVVIDQKGTVEVKQGQIKGNDSFRGKVTIPSGTTEIRVDQAWETQPFTVNITSTFNTKIWVENVDKTGFTIKIDTTQSSDKDVYWMAMW